MHTSRQDLPISVLESATGLFLLPKHNETEKFPIATYKGATSLPRRCGAALELENAGYLEVRPYAFLLEKHKETERLPKSTYKGAAALRRSARTGERGISGSAPLRRLRPEMHACRRDLPIGVPEGSTCLVWVPGRCTHVQIPNRTGKTVFWKTGPTPPLY